ncbi:MAG: hypothetical protein AAGA60_04505 [Cyanobacteria bacterium P01_E01_bin.42]
MSNAIVTLSFENLQNASNDRFFFFQDIRIDANGETYSLPTYLFLTSFALSTTKHDYSAIANAFSTALKALGIAMNNKGIITVELATFGDYIQTNLRMVMDEIDIYALFKDYIERGKYLIKKESIMIPLTV